MRTRLMYGFAVLCFASACSDSSATGDGGGDASPTPVDDGGQDVGQDVAIDTGGQDVAVDTAPPCVTTKLPTEDACVVNDAEGIFVSASMGSLAGDGTMAKPMVSLQAGITAAKSANKRVYACAETYAEAITLQDGVSVFGYFNCTNAWAVGTTHAKVQATTSPAATATSVTSTTRVESVDFVAPDFTTGSQSSIALLASGSPGLVFVNDKFHAGAGGKGADGSSGIQLVDSGTAKNGANGWNDGTCGTICLASNFLQPAGGTNVCTGETGHDGGPGGAGGYPGKFQSQFVTNTYLWVALDQGTTAGFPTVATSQTAQGGALGTAGSSGATGAAGSSGGAGAAIGVISASGYAPSDGTSGGAGAPGQGGGGSGGYFGLQNDHPASSNQGMNGWAEPGPGGGAGGCPGLAGQVGKGGGASIGIVAISSAFTLTGAVVESSNGGAAGAAGGSSSPTAGGNGGSPSTHTVTGGTGGAGGAAGVSGNGGGGPSIGLAYQGTSPTQSTTTITQGQGGAGVAQRVVNGQTIPASPSGLSQSTYSF